MTISLPDPSTLARALRANPQFHDTSEAAIEPLAMTGLAHAHWRIAGRGIVLRVPRAADPALSPAASLFREAAAFARASASRRTPRLLGIVPPSADAPFGALVVDEIVGRAPRLPDELGAIAATLAAIHTLALPTVRARAPLPDWEKPFAATLNLVEHNAKYLAAACAASEARRQIESELAWAREYAGNQAGELAALPRTLVTLDAHPGNFIVREDGTAIFVDLEKAGYGAPAIDLAHATLKPALRWGDAGDARLAPDDVAGFYRSWATAVPSALAAALRPFFIPFRRLTWLRTTMAFARFGATAATAALEPGAAARADRAIVAAFDPDEIAETRREWLGPNPLDLG
jgi:hypothetical protein